MTPRYLHIDAPSFDDAAVSLAKQPFLYSKACNLIVEVNVPAIEAHVPDIEASIVIHEARLRAT
jgi:hypothetical protein